MVIPEVVITTVVFIAVLSVLIIVHEFGHFIMAKRMGVRVERFALGFGPALWTRKKKDTEYAICAIPLGGYVKLAGDSLEEAKGGPDEYFSCPIAKRFNIIFFGPLLNYVLGFLCLWLICIIGYPMLTTKVGGLVDGLGAQKAGIAVGDKIVAIDNKKVESWEDVQKLIQAKQLTGRVTISVLRDAAPINFSVSIHQKQMDDFLGKKRNVGLIGIMASDETKIARHGVLEAVVIAGERTWDLTVLTYRAIWSMLIGRISFRESVTGPLGMFDITSKVTRLGITAVIHFLSTISISLCIFNLLPLPALDGGHLVLLFIEKIRGKALNPKIERNIAQVGFTLLITLAVVVTYNDILRIFGEKIAKFFIKN